MRCLGTCGGISSPGCVYDVFQAVQLGLRVLQAYRRIEITSVRVSLAFDVVEKLLSRQMVLNFVSAADFVHAVLVRTSGFDPSSVRIASKYLKLLTCSSFWPSGSMFV